MIPDYKNPDLSVERRAADLVSRMTLDEKVAQLHSAPWKVDLAGADGRFSPEKAERHLKNGICHVGRPAHTRRPREAAIFTNDIQRFLVAKTRLGIPALFHEEALHGHMGVGATMFPQAIAMGSTWDTEIVRRVYEAAAMETRAAGGNYVFAPNLDLARDPRWGRTEETYGEDPFLVSRMGVAAVKGLQGQGPSIGSDHVVATAKHFAAHGQPEGGSNTAPAPYSERDLRDFFLPPFQAAVIEGGVLSVMASYNEIGGVPSHVNHWLLGALLREEWGFNGYVTSDGFGVDELASIHHVAAGVRDAARLALAAGVDGEVEDGSCYSTLAEQVRSGLVEEALVDRAVARVLRVKFLLGLFENPYVDVERAEHATNSAEHRVLALAVARRAIVLLKNDQDLLPLDRTSMRTLAVIGPNAADLHLGGYGADPMRGVTILQGLQAAAGPGIAVRYAEGCRFSDGPQDWRGHFEDQVALADPGQQEPRIAEAVALAHEADAVVVVVGENESTCREAWARDHLGDRDDLGLLGRQEEMVLRVLETGKPTILVLINGRPLAIPRLVERAPAILEAWYPGQEGGTAVAEIVFGDVNPSGKLPVTFPRSVGQLPVFYNHKPSAKRGYLFTTTEPLFHFGHGLSYTTFRYENLRVEPERISRAGRAMVSVAVTNVGSRAGEEVVQLYIRDSVSSVTRPVKELKGFSRVALAPGETKVVTFELGPEHLGLWNQRMERVVEAGIFDVMVGDSSARVERIALEVVDE
ncbi:MAG: glycoside hydrolase family 3 C-terminal domain-containing protein [Vicinamibacteria bacterium]|nr:glycoside hydrolase family 3 C-terminal domain-containing protein [Vicinamibacteria bacterium]